MDKYSNDIKEKVVVLIGGSDYNGSWKVYQSVKDAKRFRSILTNDFNIASDNITMLLNEKYNRKKILKHINQLADQLKTSNCIGLISSLYSI